MNTVLLVGRITHDVEIKHVGDGYSICNISLAVRRGFKNSDGEYEVDFIPVTLWEGVANTCKEICKKGSLIALTARVHMEKRELEEGRVINQMKLIGEKLSLFSSPRQQEEQE